MAQLWHPTMAPSRRTRIRTSTTKKGTNPSQVTDALSCAQWPCKLPIRDSHCKTKLHSVIWQVLAAYSISNHACVFLFCRQHVFRSRVFFDTHVVRGHIDQTSASHMELRGWCDRAQTPKQQLDKDVPQTPCEMSTPVAPEDAKPERTRGNPSDAAHNETTEPSKNHHIKRPLQRAEQALRCKAQWHRDQLRQRKRPPASPVHRTMIRAWPHPSATRNLTFLHQLPYKIEAKTCPFLSLTVPLLFLSLLDCFFAVPFLASLLRCSSWKSAA